MTDQPNKANVIDIWPYQEEVLLERAFANMRRKSRQKKERDRNHLNDDGVVFVDSDGKEVGYLIPVADPEDNDEQ